MNQIDIFDEIIVDNFAERRGKKKITTMAQFESAVAR